MEYFDIVDETGEPTGRMTDRGTAHRDGLLHRTAQIWVIERTGNRTKVLLQRRAPEKEGYPNCLDTSSAGHIHAGDEVLPSALRELGEELGIHAQAQDLTPIGAVRLSFSWEYRGVLCRDEEISFVHVYEKPVDISTLQLQKEEVSEVLWMDFDELVSHILADDPEFCPEIGVVRLLGHYLGIPV